MDERTTRLTRKICAPPAVVYRALIDPECVKRWKFPAGMDIQIHKFEAREGGLFRVSLSYRNSSLVGKTAANTDTYHGHFEKLVEGRQVIEVLEFDTSEPSMSGAMRITYTLTETDGGTLLLATHESVPAGVRLEDNRQGWSMAIEQLAALAESKQE